MRVARSRFAPPYSRKPSYLWRPRKVIGFDRSSFREGIQVQNDDLLRVGDGHVYRSAIRTDGALMGLSKPLTRYHKLPEGLPCERIELGHFVVRVADRDDRIILG